MHSMKAYAHFTLSLVFFSTSASVIFAPESANADGGYCKLIGSNLLTEMNFPTLSKNIVLSKNMPNGTVFYSSTFRTPTPVRVNCTSAHLEGINAVGGGGSLDDFTLQTQQPGIGARIYDKEKFTYLRRYASEPNVAAGDKNFNSTFTLELVKLGPIKLGTVLPSGPLLYLYYDQLMIARFGFADSIKFTEPTCNTPNVSVDMGTQKSTEFNKVNTALPSKPLVIKLNNCPTGISKVTYRLDPTTAILDKAKSVIALSGDSTATGVAVQILDNKNAYLPLGTAITFDGYNSAGGNYAISLNAAYYQTTTSITAGSANTSLTFTLTYD